MVSGTAFALRTVELWGQLEAGSTQELPNLVGVCRQAVVPQETCQTAGAIAMEKGRLGAVEQVELGFLGLDLVLALIQVAKASTDTVGTLTFWAILEAGMGDSWLASRDHHIRSGGDGRGLEGSDGGCAVVSGWCLLWAPLPAGCWALGAGSKWGGFSLPGGVVVSPGLQVSKG